MCNLTSVHTELKVTKESGLTYSFCSRHGLGSGSRMVRVSGRSVAADVLCPPPSKRIGLNFSTSGVKDNISVSALFTQRGGGQGDAVVSA